MQALTYLQRALLVHDLQTLDAAEWESCFNKVRRPPETCEFSHSCSHGLMCVYVHV